MSRYCPETGSEIFDSHRAANRAARRQTMRGHLTRRLVVYPCGDHYHVGRERRRRPIRRAA